MKPQWIKYLPVLAGWWVVLMLAGCASYDPDRESDMPWNTPQSWEGSPAIPGLNP